MRWNSEIDLLRLVKESSVATELGNWFRKLHVEEAKKKREKQRLYKERVLCIGRSRLLNKEVNKMWEGSENFAPSPNLLWLREQLSSTLTWTLGGRGEVEGFGT